MTLGFTKVRHPCNKLFSIKQTKKKDESRHIQRSRVFADPVPETSDSYDLLSSCFGINVLTCFCVYLVTFAGGVECRFFREELSSISEFFRALLKGNFLEKSQDVIGLQHVKIDSFLTLLSCYRDKISWMERADNNDGGDPATNATCQKFVYFLVFQADRKVRHRKYNFLFSKNTLRDDIGICCSI